MLVCTEDDTISLLLVYVSGTDPVQADFLAPGVPLTQELVPISVKLSHPDNPGPADDILIGAPDEAAKGPVAVWERQRRELAKCME